MAKDTTVRAIVFREGDQLVAQCLEYDIGAQASDPETLHERLVMTLYAECMTRGGSEADPFPGIDPAPEYFQQLWDNCNYELTPKKAPARLHSKGPSIRMALCAA